MKMEIIFKPVNIIHCIVLFWLARYFVMFHKLRTIKTQRPILALRRFIAAYREKKLSYLTKQKGKFIAQDGKKVKFIAYIIISWLMGTDCLLLPVDTALGTSYTMAT